MAHVQFLANLFVVIAITVWSQLLEKFRAIGFLCNFPGRLRLQQFSGQTLEQAVPTDAQTFQQSNN
jgi:hypothetical protein